MTDINDYWARSPLDKLAGAVREKVRAYHEHIRDTGRLAAWMRATRMYYGLDADGGWSNSAAVTFGGRQGELVQLRMNHFGSLQRLIHTLVTATRPNFASRASNNDTESVSAVALADALLDDALSNLGLEEAAVQAARWSGYLSEGWLVGTWDEDAGDEHVPDESGQMLRKGEPRYEPYHPIDVIRETSLRKPRFAWLILRRYVSRWELAAKYPELADRILGASADYEFVQADTWLSLRLTRDQETIAVYDVYHEAGALVPGGLVATCCGDLVLPGVGPMPYKSLANVAVMMMPEAEDQTCFGFSHLWDLMAPQALYDSILTTAASNHDAHGLQNVWTKKGDDMSVEAMAGGIRSVQSIEKPESLQLTDVSEHSYRLLEVTQQGMELLSGGNSMSRGAVPENVKSGTMAAFVDSKALQFNSGAQRTYATGYAKIATGTIEMYQAFGGSSERAVAVVGADERGALIRYTAEALKPITRVVVTLADPSLRTNAGRMDLAKIFLDAKLIEDPRQFMDLVSTGRWEEIVQNPSMQFQLVRAEREALIKGEQVLVHFSQDPTLHLREHAALLASPAAYNDPALVARVSEHMQEHVTVWYQTDPAILAALGYQPPPAPMAPGGPPPGEDGAPVPGGAPEDPAAPGRATMPGVDAPPGGDRPPMPMMPVNPSTGERVRAPGGDA